jgi:FkbM family methyltransferase
MCVPRTSAATWEPAFTGRYDDEHLDWLEPLIEPRSLVLDVGACFGFYTIPLAKAAEVVDAWVLAFEPLSVNVRILEVNLHRNHVRNATIVRQGLAERSIRGAQVTVEPYGVGNAAIAIPDHAPPPGHSSFERVDLSRLDEVALPAACKGRRCALVKMDVEGLEMSVLAGGEEFFRQHRPLIFGEFSPWWFAERGVSPSAPFDWAQSHEYRAFEARRERRTAWSDRRPVTIRSVATDGWSTDLVLAPKEHPMSMAKMK